MNDEPTHEQLTQRCRDCQALFTLRPQEVDFYERRGLHVPKRCSDCRRLRREAAAAAAGDIERTA